MREASRSSFVTVVISLAVAACAPDPAGAPPPAVASAPPSSSAVSTTASPAAAPAAIPCDASWSTQPALEAALVPGSSGLRVVARYAASGTQNYTCSGGDAGTFAWTLAGPEAVLSDCHGAPAGKHFASAGPGTPPAWQLADGSQVVARKVASVPSKAAGAVPWLLLEAHGGSGALAAVEDVQRLGTSGGIAPAAGCDAAHAGAVEKVPYTAEYWFLGK